MGTGMGMGMGMGMMKPMATSPPPMTGAPLVPNQGVMSPMSPPSRTTTTSPGAAGAQPKAASANFDDLWSMSLGASSKPAAGGMGAQKSMKDLEKEKAQASIWGGGQQRPPMGAPLGSFGGAPASNAAPASSSGNGLDDLLF